MGQAARVVAKVWRFQSVLSSRTAGQRHTYASHRAYKILRATGLVPAGRGVLRTCRLRFATQDDPRHQETGRTAVSLNEGPARRTPLGALSVGMRGPLSR